MTGCTNPKAANYSKTATQDDGSCLYLYHTKEDGVCHLFKEATDVTRQDFTASYSMMLGEWTFFHDYIADDFITARNGLYGVKHNSIFQHNVGPYGKYYDDTVHPFFVDVVVTEGSESLLSALQWVSEVIDSTGKDREDVTFSHITVWNNYQCTGRIPAASAFKDLQYAHMRRSHGVWNFNELRDVVKNNDSQFLLDLFRDYAVDPNAINVNLPWYRKAILRDDHFVVRLEFDNTQNYNILLHQLGALMDKPL